MKKQTLISIFLTIFFVGLISVTIGYQYYRTQTAQDEYITQDIARLGNIFNRIHHSCKIISFEHEKNYIDFLTVKSFVGSEVGLMNLAYPEKWEGPYLLDNPTMQEKYYMVVRTNKGHFIVPGDGGEYCDEARKGGVKLANGKVIGKDIIFTSSSDIAAMMRDPEMLFSDKGALAMQIPVGNETVFDTYKVIDELGSAS